MNAVDNIKRMLYSLQPLSDEEWKNHSDYFIFKDFKKGEFLIREGETESNMYYLDSGTTRNFFMHNDKEFTVDFHFPGDFVTAFYSLITSGPSVVSIEVIQDAHVVIIPYRQIEGLHKNSLNSNIIGRKMAEMHYIKRLEKERDLLALTAEERYNKLLQYKPEFVKALSVKHLSSYLGVPPESLSRIRKKTL